MHSIETETRRWLVYAQRDLKAAEKLLEQADLFAQQICFLSQQAAEKSLKAALIFLQAEFPFRHDLDMLRNLLPPEWQCQQLCPNLEELTEWAVEARYPSFSEDAFEEDAQRAFQQAISVFEAILLDLTRQDFSL